MNRTGQRVRAAIATVAVLAAVGLVVGLALQADGRQAKRASSHDGGAWLVDQPRGQVRHIEHRTHQATTTVSIAAESDANLVARQAGDITLVHDRDSGNVTFVRATTGTIDNSSFFAPQGADVWATNTGVAIHHRARQDVWLLSRSQVGRINSVDDPGDPERRVAPVDATALIITHAGDVVLADDDNRIQVVGSGRAANLPADVADLPLQLSASGNDPVAEVGGRWFVMGQTGWRELVADAPATLMSQATEPSTAAGFIDDAGRLATIDLVTGDITARGQVQGEVVDLIWHRGCGYMLVQPQAGGLLDAVIRCDEGESVHALDTAQAELRLVNGWVWVDGQGTGDWLVDDRQFVEVLSQAEPTPVRTPDATPTATSPVEQGSADEADRTQPCTDLSSAPTDPVAVDDNRQATMIAGQPQPPTRFATRIGRPVVVDVLRNDFDADCDVLLIESVTLTSGDAEIDRTPDRRFIAVNPSGGAQTIDFEYTVTDGTGRSATATGQVDVLPESAVDNRPPTPRLDRLIGASGRVVRVNVLDNDVDPDGDSLRLVSVGDSDPNSESDILASHPGGETLIALPDITEDRDAHRIPYTVADEWGATTQGEVEVIVRLAQSNYKPDARNDSAVTRVGQRVTVNLLANDVDGDNDELTVARSATVTQTPDDSASVFASTNSGGELMFEADQPGTYLLAYQASDGTSGDSAKVRIEVVAASQNQAPVAVRDNTVVQLGESRIVRALHNDGDPDGDVIGITFMTANDDLDVKVLNRTSFVVRLEPDADNIETFQYRVSDGELESELTTVVVARSDEPFVDGPPVAVDDSVRVRSGRTSLVRVLPNDFDPEGHAIRLADPEGTPLTVQGADEVISGVAATVGQDRRFVSVRVDPDVEPFPFNFGYSIVDDVNEDTRASALVQVSIVGEAEQNKPPIARTDRAVVGLDAGIEIPVLDNDTDPESDPIALTGALPVVPKAGSVTISENGTLFYTSNSGVSGTDRFTYEIVDSEGAASVGIVEVGVLRPSRQNNPPVAADDPDFQFVAGAGRQFLDVLANDTDFDGDVLRVVAVTGSDDVEVTSDGAGLEVVLPDLSSNEEMIGVEYTIADGRGGIDEGQVTIEVLPNVEPVPPVAEADTAGPFRAGEVVTVDVLANDYDPDARPNFGPDGRRTDLRIVPVGPGTAAVLEPQPSPDGSGRLVQAELLELTVPATTSEVPYAIVDAQGLRASSFITVRVEPNLPPEVQDPIVVPLDGVPHPNAEPLIIDLAQFVSDPDGDELTYFLPGSGTSSLGGTVDLDGSVMTFVPDRAATEGRTTFAVRDHISNDVTREVAILLEGPSNRPPQGLDATIEVEAGIDQPIELAAFFVDPDDDPLSFAVVTEPEDPVSVQGDATAGVVDLVVPTVADESTTTLRVEASDGVDSAQATLTINVLPTSIDPPVAQPDEVTTNQGQAVTVDVLANDIDLLGEGLTLVSALAPAETGTATITDGGIVFEPAPEFFGPAVIRYAIQDARGRADGQSEGLLTISVIGRPSAPTQVDAEATGPTNVSLTWRSPQDNGAPIQSFVIKVFANGAEQRTVTSDSVDPQLSLADLVAGESYEFEVAATNSAGQGDWSQRSNLAIPDAVPAAPGTPRVTFSDVGPGELTVSWNEPAQPGSPITRYRVEGACPNANPSHEPEGTSHTFAGLPDGERCTFRVHGINLAIERGGAPQWSPESIPECPVGLPGQPSPPSPIRGNGLAELTWAPPTNPDCEALLGYEIQRVRNGSDDGTATRAAFGQTQLTSAPLVNGEEYQFAIRAQNRRGWGPWSDRSEVVTPCARPDAPTIEGARDDGAAIISIVGDTVDNGCQITGFFVNVSGQSTVSLPADGRIGGLTNGQDYTFEVYAVNEVVDEQGPSDLSNAVTITPAGRPLPGEVYGFPGGEELVTGALVMRWRALWDHEMTNGSRLTSTSLIGDVVNFDQGINPELSGAWGEGDCVNAQGNPCLLVGPSSGVEERTDCLQHEQTVTATGTATNDVGTSDPAVYSIDLGGCPASSSSLVVTDIDTIGGSYRVSWVTPPQADAVFLQRNESQPFAWLGPYTTESAVLDLPEDNRDTTIKMWACNIYGCTGGNEETVVVPLEIEWLHFGEFRCWDTRDQVDLETAPVIARVHGFGPLEDVQATWQPEHDLDDGRSTSSADSNGVRQVKWECSNDPDNYASAALPRWVTIRLTQTTGATADRYIDLDIYTVEGPP